MRKLQRVARKVGGQTDNRTAVGTGERRGASLATGQGFLGRVPNGERFLLSVCSILGHLTGSGRKKLASFD